MDNRAFRTGFLALSIAMMFATGMAYATSNSIQPTTLTIYGTSSGSVLPLRFAPNYTTYDYISTGYTTVIPIYISNATATTYNGNVPYQWQGAGTTVTTNGVVYTMVPSTYTQIIKVGQNNILGFYVYLNESLWTSNEVAELKASNASLATAQLMIKAIENTSTTTTFNGVAAAGTIINSAKYLNGTVNFVSTNVLKATQKMPITAIWQNHTYTYVNNGVNGSINLVLSNYVKTANGIALSSNSMNLTVMLSANALNKIKYSYGTSTSGTPALSNITASNISISLPVENLAPGSSYTVQFDSAGGPNYTAVDPSVTYTIANSNYNVQGTQTLGSDLVVGNLTINGGNTLNTDGYNLYVNNTFNGIGGTINTGTANNGGSAGPNANPGAAGAYGLYLQAKILKVGIINAVGGIGVNASGSASPVFNASASGGTGGSTLVSGGGGGSWTPYPGHTPTSGGTPSSPTLTNTNIATMYLNGFKNYLVGGGGGGGQGVGCSTGCSGGGGGGNTLSYGGSGGGGDYFVTVNPSCSYREVGTGGGGGGGAVILSYNSYTAGTVNVIGGAGVGITNNLCQAVNYSGSGGNGQLVTYQYTTQPISISCSNCYTAPTVTIGNPTNTIADADQWQSFTATISGGSANFAYSFNAVNSISTGTIVNSLSVSGQSSSTYTWSYYIGSAQVSNSPIEANVLITDSHPNSANSVYSSTYSVHPALSAVTLSISNTLLDANQWECFTPTITGGASPYSYNFIISNTVTGTPINSITGVSASPSGCIYLPAWIQGNTIQANAIITDSATTNEILASSDTALGFNSVMTTPTLAVLPSAPSNQLVGNVLTFNAYVLDGTSPYSYRFNIYNSITSVLVDSVTSSANNIAYTIPSNEALQTIYANVVAKDSATSNGISNSVASGVFTVLQNATYSRFIKYTSQSGISATLPTNGTQNITSAGSFTIATQVKTTNNYLSANLFIYKLIGGVKYFLNGTIIGSNALAPNLTTNYFQQTTYYFQPGIYVFTFNSPGGGEYSGFSLTFNINQTQAATPPSGGGGGGGGGSSGPSCGLGTTYNLTTGSCVSILNPISKALTGLGNATPTVTYSPNFKSPGNNVVLDALAVFYGAQINNTVSLWPLLAIFAALASVALYKKKDPRWRWSATLVVLLGFFWAFNSYIVPVIWASGA